MVNANQLPYRYGPREGQKTKCKTPYIRLCVNNFTSSSVGANESISHTICGMCSKSYNDPRILPCLHSFCQQCLLHEIEKSDSQQVFKCPTCDHSMSIPVGGASGLPQNLHLGFEVEVAGYMSKIVGNSEVCCDECIDGGSGPAEVFCCTCRQFLCAFCHEYHKRNRKWSEHNTVGLDQEGAKQLQSTMKPKEYYCSQPNHEDNKLNFYCETCTLLVCRDCTTLAHKDHGVAELSTVAEVHRGEMKGTLQHVQDTLADAFGANQKKKEQVEISKHVAELTIKQAFEQLYERLEERKKVLLSQIESIALTQATGLTLQKEQLEKIQQDISQYPEVTSHILQTHTDHEVVAMGGLVPTELKAIIKKVENVVIPTSHYGPITAQFTSHSLTKEISSFGDVFDQSPAPGQSIITFQKVFRENEKCVVKLETRMFNGERYPRGGVKVQAEMRSKNHNGAVVFGEVEDRRDGIYTITLTPQAAGLHQFLITMEGQHVQNSPLDLDVRSKPDYLTLCKPQQVIECHDPFFVAVDDSGDVYVTSFDHRIYVFDQTGQLKNTIGSYGSDDGQFDCPHGICIKGDEMYVADGENNRIQKLTLKGEFLSSFGEYGSDRGEFECPTAIIVDSNNRLIVCDTYKVQIFNQDGAWILTIDGTGAGKQSFGFIQDIALDPLGNIHIATYEDTIKVFTKKGVYVRSYGGKDIHSGIAIDEQGYSFVTNASRLTIFDPNGNEIHTVRDLVFPNGIALDPRDSSVYVVDKCTVLKYSI